MFRFTPLVDLPLLVGVWAVTLSGTLYWLLKSSQKQVPRTQEVVARASFRITLLIALIGLSCWLVGISFWVLIAASLVALLLGLGGPAAGPLCAPFFFVVMFAKEYVLGFPEFVLSPPTERPVPSTKQPHPLHGKTGTALGPLCPQGDVKIVGEQYPAASANGKLIDAKASVVVVGHKNGIILVAENKPATKD